MSNCPYCNSPLSDDWLQRRAASLMGKAGGSAKARANARQAAQIRWQRVRAAKARNRFVKITTGAKEIQ